MIEEGYLHITEKRAVPEQSLVVLGTLMFQPQKKTFVNANQKIFV